MHSKISFDTESEPMDMVRAAEAAGLKEICFTDHYDHNDKIECHHDIFTLEDYNRVYSDVTSDSVKIRRGVEMGLTLWNKELADRFITEGDFDFVIGSIHYTDAGDPYFPEFWEGMDFDGAIDRYMQRTLDCVRLHDNFDVLGHLTYVCKSEHNPAKRTVTYREIADIADEIMKCLVAKGKGMEINTSGVDRAGDYLPSADFLRRFREFGGEIVTIGSDAHDGSRVGQYSAEAMAIAGEIFGHICTFEKRQPVFHKLK